MSRRRRISQWFRLCLLLPVLVLGILMPKVSVLAAHLNPHIMTVVICTGTELVTLQIGPDGQPVETGEDAHTPCVVADASHLEERKDQIWAVVPRSFCVDFCDTSAPERNRRAPGLLPDPRGPPSVV